MQMFEKGRYKDTSNHEVEKDLQEQGYNPLLISELPNDVLAKHSHKESHILVVVDGEMKVDLEGKKLIMKPGDQLSIGSGVSHAAFFGTKGCKYYWVEY